MVPTYGANDPRTRALDKRLQASAAAFAKATGTQGGGGRQRRVARPVPQRGRLQAAAVIAGIALFTYLLLLLITRSLILPAVAAVLNLVTAGATFGVLTLLFGSQPAGAQRTRASWTR